MQQISVFLFSVFLLTACNGIPEQAETDNSNPPPPFISYKIVKVYPHDTSYYTEGLELFNGKIFESGGNYGRSKFGFRTIGEGKPEKEIKLEDAYFGEGITVFNNKIYLLTWQQHKVFIYDAVSLEKVKESEWPFEGWGMTHNDKELIISTGSSNLYFVNPDDFKIIRTVGVNDQYGPVSNINELEFVNGAIYANQYQTNYILQINPETGKVTGKLDLSNILEKSGQAYDPAKVDVLNGIAFDSTKNSFYITGKNWPALFELKLN